MPLVPDQNLLHYRLIEKLGEGGMGVVWKALDTTLDREVAVKVLAETVATSPDRLARFDREAKLLASLNHRNIAAIYGFHECDGVRFVAMELVHGEDLSQRLLRGALPVAEALEIAEQIAEALAAAHDRGVVHRDLKPANVRLAPDGTVKVLDFGLAKSLEAEPVSGDASVSPTVTLTGTAAGMILGTAAYMSPEQARGRAVDRRADMWALGCVIYEMLTGRPAFPGETIPDILSAVIGREPDWDLLPPGTPVATRRLLRRCLEKKAAQRVRDAADARLELAEIDESPRESSAQAVPPAGRGMRRVLGAVGLVVVTAILTAAVLRVLAPASSDVPTPRLANERQVTFSGDVWPEIDLAVDGRTAVYLTRDRDNVVLLDLDGGGSQTIYTAPAGSTLDDVQWSPDSGRVYLMKWPYANRVSSIPRFGGEPRQELDLQHLSGLGGIEVQRLADGNWVVTGIRNTLYVGNDPAGLQARDGKMFGDGVSSIPGLRVLGGVVPSRDGSWLAFAGSDEGERLVAGVIAAQSAESPGAIDAWAGLAPVGWSTDGRRLYLWRAGAGIDTVDLFRVTMDPATGAPTAEPVLVAPRLPARGLRVSGDGSRLALVAGPRIRNLMEMSLDDTPDSTDNPRRMRTRGTGRWSVWDFFPDGDLLAVLAVDNGAELFAIEADGTRRSLQRLKGWPTAMAVSPDGGTIAVALDATASSLMLLEVESGRSRKLDVPEPLASLAWSPDGIHLAAMTYRSADRLVTIDVTSSTARTVQLDCGSRCEFAYENIAIGPQWPWAAVTSEVDTWVVNVESGALRHLATDTWSIDGWLGDWIYFARGGGQTDWPGIVAYRIPAQGGAEERLLDLPTACDSFDLAPDGRSIVCDFDESLLDVRVIEGFDPGG